jgi:hypothetical protein
VMTHLVCLRWQLQWPLCSILFIIQLNCAKGAKSHRKPGAFPVEGKFERSNREIYLPGVLR